MRTKWHRILRDNTIELLLDTMYFAHYSPQTKWAGEQLALPDCTPGALPTALLTDPLTASLEVGAPLAHLALQGVAASSSRDPREIRPGIKRLVRLELTTSTLEAWRSTY
jgi:hypothetical protein